jgi:quercetin dioxygenase-like cupin family protein
MRIVQDFYKSGVICGIVYTLSQGSGIPMHAHREKQYYHNTVVLKGSVLVYGKDWQKVVKAGEMADFDSSQPHEIHALEDNTRIINMFVNGVPMEWGAMAIKTEIETNLTYKINDYSRPTIELVLLG